MRVNGVARAFWAEVLAGIDTANGRTVPRNPMRQRTRLVRTASGRVRRQGAGRRYP
jgi:hypothetical protein